MLKIEDISERKLEWLKWAIKAYSAPQASGCWGWLRSKNKNGYGGMRVNSKQEFVHRVSYVIFKGPIPEGLCVCHTCDNPWCVNPDHLWLGTHKENSQDMVRKNRVSRKYHGGGFREGHPHSKKKRKSKLTDDQVREIRATLYNREALKDIASRYGVSLACVSLIRSGKRKQLIQN